MKKRIALITLSVLVVIAAFFAWKLYGASVKTPEGKYLYVPTGQTMDQLRSSLVEQKIINGTTWFDWTAKILRFKTVKPGRYEIKKGTSLMNFIRMLRSGDQSPVNFVITKLRTKESLAGKAGKVFECDSTEMIRFLNSPDSLKAYNVDTNTVMALAMPLTYSIKWNTTPGKIMQQFATAYKTFWNNDRTQKAANLGLTPIEVSTLAAIIDEETNAKSDRPNVASVYLNRINKGMPLQADPTVKFAMKNFALRRILNEHLKYPSPYNTYLNKGLPPGPICTPAGETIDAVLDSPKTEYIYFVANSDFSGTHIFTTNYADHLKYARLFQQELNKRNIK
jgi:UPF0755 protein